MIIFLNILQGVPSYTSKLLEYIEDDWHDEDKVRRLWVGIVIMKIVAIKSKAEDIIFTHFIAWDADSKPLPDTEFYGDYKTALQQDPDTPYKFFINDYDLVKGEHKRE